MNTSDHAYEYDGLDYTYLETPAFARYVINLRRAILTATRENRKMKIPHNDRNRPYGATIADMKRALGEEVQERWLYSALRNLEGEGSVYQFQSGAMTRWACKKVPVVIKQKYNNTAVHRPRAPRPDVEVFEGRDRVTA